MGIFDNRGMYRGYELNPSIPAGFVLNPFNNIQNKGETLYKDLSTFSFPNQSFSDNPIIGENKFTNVFAGGRSLLDNIYGRSADRDYKINTPNVVRMANANTSGLFRNRTPTKSSGAFVDPNIDNPLLRNYPQLRDQINNVYSRIPENQRKFVTVQDGKVVFDLPEEFEFGNPNTTTNQTENVTSNIPQFNTEQEYLKASGLLDQQRKQPTTTTGTSQNTSAKKRKGLLDQFKDFVKSDYGTDFAMGLLQQSGYSTMPQTLGQAIGMADEYATNKSLAREELDIKRQAAQKKNVDKKDFAYIVKNPNDGSIYNAYQTDSGIVVDVNGKDKPFRNNMFGGELPAEISTVGNLGDTNISGNAFIKIKSDLETTENQLQKIARYMENVDTAPQGMEKLATQFNTYIKTILADNDLNPQELKQAIIAGEFQGLIGANRVEVVGGGVMTEQDAARIMLALGGDPANIATNPDVVIGLMSNIFAEKYNTYKDALETYNINVTSGGFTNYPKKELIKFNDNFLETINPQKLLELDLSDIPNFSKNQLFRLLRNNTDANGEVIEERFSNLEISQIIELAKKYNIEIDLGE
jgi:hypothetical protein